MKSFVIGLKRKLMIQGTTTSTGITLDGDTLSIAGNNTMPEVNTGGSTDIDVISVHDMPLASKDGKLIAKDGKLCSTCCDSGDGSGACCSFPYRDSGPQPANTAAEAIKLASQSASANSAAIEGSTWTVGYFKDGRWFEGGADFDPSRNQYNRLLLRCPCEDVDSDDCKGPFTHFAVDKDCDSYNCPSPPASYVCFYRADGKGTCYQWIVPETEYDYESADTRRGSVYASFYTDGACGTCPINPDNLSEGWCCDREPDWGNHSLGTTTEENCKSPELSPIDLVEKDVKTQAEVQSAHDELVDSKWENDLPANKCKPVDSEEECTESTGVFCLNLTECPDDPSEGCPETPIRRNPLP